MDEKLTVGSRFKCQWAFGFWFAFYLYSSASTESYTRNETQFLFLTLSVRYQPAEFLKPIAIQTLREMNRLESIPVNIHCCFLDVLFSCLGRLCDTVHSSTRGFSLLWRVVPQYAQSTLRQPVPASLVAHSRLISRIAA